MLYLTLGVMVMVYNALVLKWGETRGQDRLVVGAVNYGVAALLAGAIWGAAGAVAPGSGTLVLGPIGGFFYAVSLVVWLGAMAHGGLALATAAQRLSVFWPTAVSVLIFLEVPTGAQTAGVLLGLLVLVLLSVNSVLRARGGPVRDSGLYWLLGTFCMNGGPGIVQKVFTEFARPADKPAMLALIFFFAFLVCMAAIAGGRLRGPGRQRRLLRRGDVLRGFLFGFGNVGSNYLVLRGLQDVAGVVAFPFVNSSVIVAATVAGLLVWRERPGPVGLAAIALAGVAIVLMALG